MHCGRVFLHGLFLQQAQYLQRTRLGIPNDACAVTTRAGDVRAFVQRGTQALARQLHQTETGDLAHLDTGAVEVQGVAQAVFDGALVLAVFHVDEIDHDQTAQIAQAQLAGDFVGGLKVRAGRGFFDVGATGGTRRVDVDGDQGLGVIDDDRSARGQFDCPRVGRFDLVLDLEA